MTGADSQEADQMRQVSDSVHYLLKAKNSLDDALASFNSENNTEVLRDVMQCLEFALEALAIVIKESEK